MNVYRGGVPLVICDGCFRPQRADEDDWARSTRSVPYRSPDDVLTGAESTSTVDVVADYCPECCPPEIRAWAS